MRLKTVKDSKEYPVAIEEAFDSMDATIHPAEIYRHSLVIAKYMTRHKDQMLHARYAMSICRYYIMNKEFDKAQELLTEFKNSRIANKVPELSGRYYLHSSRLSYRVHAGKEALQQAEKALEYFSHAGSLKWQVLALTQIYNCINTFDHPHQYDNIELLFRTTSLCEKAGLFDELMINQYSLACSGIATQYFMEEKYAEAYSFLETPYQKLFAIKSPHHYYLRAFMGSALAYQNRFEEARRIFLEIYNDEYRKLTPSFNLYLSHLLLACALATETMADFLPHYHEYLADVEKFNLPFENLKAICIRAEKEASEKNYENAQLALNQARKLLEDFAMTEAFQRIYYDAAWKVYERAGEYKLGWEAYKKCEEFRIKGMDSLTEKKIEVLKNRVDMEKQTKENELLKMELEINSLELEMTATFLQKKNAMIDDILSFTNMLSKKHKHQNALFEIKKKLIGMKSEDTDKEKIKTLLDKGNQEYIKKVTSKYPAITNTEAKLCALIKTGLGNKEIASLLVTSPRTVDTHRSNIRGKMGLTPADNLERVLREI